jgi:hypothetical protein
LEVEERLFTNPSDGHSINAITVTDDMDTGGLGKCTSR